MTDLTRMRVFASGLVVGAAAASIAAAIRALAGKEQEK